MLLIAERFHRRRALGFVNCVFGQTGNIVEPWKRRTWCITWSLGDADVSSRGAHRGAPPVVTRYQGCAETGGSFPGIHGEKLGVGDPNEPW